MRVCVRACMRLHCLHVCRRRARTRGGSVASVRSVCGVCQVWAWRVLLCARARALCGTLERTRRIGDLGGVPPPGVGLEEGRGRGKL